MRRAGAIGIGGFAAGVLVGMLAALYATDTAWLRGTLQAAVSWSVLSDVISLSAAVIGSLAAAVGLPMIYFQLRHTEQQTRAALGDEDPYVDCVERLLRPGELVAKIVNLNRRAVRVVDASIEGGSAGYAIQVVDINDSKTHPQSGKPYRLPCMIPGWGNRSEEPPWMMIDLARAAPADGETAPASIFAGHHGAIHCHVVAVPVGSGKPIHMTCRVISEQEIRSAPRPWRQGAMKDAAPAAQP